MNVYNYLLLLMPLVGIAMVFAAFHFMPGTKKHPRPGE